MTTDTDSAPRGAVLDPIDRISEILFGLFIANYEFGWVTPQMLDLFDREAVYNRS